MTKSNVYPELHGFRVEGVQAPPPAFPDRCPVCGAETAGGEHGGTEYPTQIYACGGRYRPKPQCQTHTYVWWGSCPQGEKAAEARIDFSRVHDHSDVADRVLVAAETYQAEVDEALAAGPGGADDDTLARLGMLLRTVRKAVPAPDEQLLAASPCFAGPGTRPYRVALLGLMDGSFVVCNLYQDDTEGRDGGDYFKAGRYADAMRRWLVRTGWEVEHRDERCWEMKPIA